MIRETGRHGRGARPITAWRLLAPSRVRHIELQAQRHVRTTEMVIRPLPLQVSEQFASELGRGPGAARQSRQRVTQGQIDSLHESGVERAGKPERLEMVGEVERVATGESG